MSVHVLERDVNSCRHGVGNPAELRSGAQFSHSTGARGACRLTQRPFPIRLVAASQMLCFIMTLMWLQVKSAEWLHEETRNIWLVPRWPPVFCWSALLRSRPVNHCITCSESSTFRVEFTNSWSQVCRKYTLMSFWAAVSSPSSFSRCASGVSEQLYSSVWVRFWLFILSRPRHQVVRCLKQCWSF